MEFDITPITSSIIMVVGVGGGGGNAVSHMYRQGLADVSFMICNTDAQALAKSPIPNKIQMGEGLGAGNNPDKGRRDAEKSIDAIKEMFSVNNTHMVFVTAGMGGGTGTGAAPVIAAAAKEMGILTVAIVTIPFESEGRPRIEQAVEGITQLRDHVDSLIIINNAHIVEIYGDLPFRRAFAKADDILATAAKSISEIITKPHLINVDFADVKRVMENSGVAIMGSAIASGENRAIRALSEAMSSPLLHHRSIAGAKQVLVSIASCEGDEEITMSETGQITTYIQECSATGNNTNLIWGIGFDESLESGEIRATVVATGFDVESIPALKQYYGKTLGINKNVEKSTDNVNSFVEKSTVVSAAKERREVVSFEDDEQPVKKPKRDYEYDSSEFLVVDKVESEPLQQETIAVVENTVVEVESNTNSYFTTSAVRQAYERPLVSEPSITEINIEQVTASDSGENNKDVVEQQELGLPREEYTKAAVEKTIVPQNSVPNGRRSIFEMSAEDVEDIPAWLRRNVDFENNLPEGIRIKRETLDIEESADTKYNTINLFD